MDTSIGWDDPKHPMVSASTTKTKSTLTAPSTTTRTTTATATTQLPEINALCRTIQSELQNMSKALNCPLCLSSLRKAVILPACVHAYCQSCLDTSLQQQEQQNKLLDQSGNVLKCPTCNQKCQRRSKVAAPVLDELVTAYKGCLRSFGLAPVRYEPSICQYALTQLQDDEADQEEGDGDGNSQRFIQIHEHLQTSRVFGKAFAPAGEKGKNATPVPSFWHHQQQKVISANERALVKASVAKMKRRREQKQQQTKPPTQPPSYSQLATAAIEQEAANADEEEWRNEDENCQEIVVNNTNSSNNKSNVTSEASTQKRSQQIYDGHEDSTKESCSRKGEDPNLDITRIAAAVGVTEQNGKGEMASSSCGVAVSKETTKLLLDDFDICNDNDIGGADSELAARMQQRRRRRQPIWRENNISLSLDSTKLPLDNGNKEADSTSETDSYVALRTATKREKESQKHPPINHIQDTRRDSQEENDESNPDKKSKETSAATTLQPKIEQATDVTESDMNSKATLDVGSIVHVQARTWPGVNKHGGVGRITRVYRSSLPGNNDIECTAEKATASAFDISYVLGGREKRVDAVFVSLHDPELAGTGPQQRVSLDVVQQNASKSRRLSDGGDDKKGEKGARSNRRNRFPSDQSERKVSYRLAKQVEEKIPATLLAQLAKEGFDITGRQKEHAVTTVASPVNIEAATKENNSLAGKKRSALKNTTSTSRKKQRLLDALPSSLARRSNRKKVAPVDASEIAPILMPGKKKQKTTTESLGTTTTSNLGKFISRVSQRSRSKKTVKTDDASSLSGTHNSCTVASLTNEEMCKYADALYQDRIESAMSKGMVVVTPSMITTDIQKESLMTLVAISKNGTGVKLKVSDSIHPQKTTMCLLPAAHPGIQDQGDLAAGRRSIKAMTAAIMGIPIVSASAWIASCLREKSILKPEPSMFIRSLPTKTTSVKANFCSFGISYTAAAIRLNGSSCNGSFTPLRNHYVFLCGSLSRKIQNDTIPLLRESGAKILPNSAALTTKIKSLQSSLASKTSKASAGDTKIVLLCGETNARTKLISSAAEKQFQKHVQFILVVNLNWLFDTISCGIALSAKDYEPVGTHAKELRRKVACN